MTFTTLSENEQIVVKAFDQYGELLLPEWALASLFTRSQVYSLLLSLQHKGIITNTRPLCLTKLGKKLFKMYKN